MGRHMPTGSAMAGRVRLLPVLGDLALETKEWELGVPPGGKEIHMKKAPKAEQVPCDLLVE